MSSTQYDIQAVLDRVKRDLPIPAVGIPGDSTNMGAVHGSIAYNHAGKHYEQAGVLVGTVENGDGLNFIAELDLNNTGKPDITAQGVDGTVTITSGGTPMTLTGDQAEKFIAAIRVFKKAEMESGMEGTKGAVMTPKYTAAYRSIVDILENPTSANAPAVNAMPSRPSPQQR